MINRCLMVAAGVLLCGCSDCVTTEFATLEQAKAARAFERGWLPPMLPEGSTRIVERNDLDLNKGEGSFHFPAESLTSYLAAVKTELKAEVFENSPEIQVRITSASSRWTVRLDRKSGTGKYTVGLH